jgi:hypothetical protein
MTTTETAHGPDDGSPMPEVDDQHELVVFDVLEGDCHVARASQMVALRPAR